MPHEHRYEDGHEHDHDDANCGSPASAAFVYDNRTVSHSVVCSFQSYRPLIPIRGAVCPDGFLAVIAWSTAGLLLALSVAVVALRHGGARAGHHYASGVYGMTAAGHRGFAAAGFGLAAVFAVSYGWSGIPVIPVLGVAVLVAVFYFTSFLRGFSDEE